jgi:hypothetical protein
MNTKKLHYFSGILIFIFITIHLFNHSFAIFGAERHIELMTTLRLVYRNIWLESLLIFAVVFQIFTGIILFIKKRKFVETFFEKLQIFTGLYLSGFFIIHLGAVFVGRIIFDLDTNFYFGVAGLNTFPFNLFFIPYYSLAVVSFSGHIASIHSQKMKNRIVGLTPDFQSWMILILGIIFTCFLIYGLTNGFQFYEIPSEYNILIGK